MNTAFQNIQVAILLLTLSAVIAAIVAPLILAAFETLLKAQNKRHARKRFSHAARRLQAELMFAPEPYAPNEERTRYERECQNLREEMASITERHGIHPFDAIKPF